MSAVLGDMLIDIDYALAQIGVNHREMEMADAYYMINKYVAANSKAGS